MRAAYIGTAYAGFQVQKNAPTIQQTLQDAFEKLYGKRYPLTGCSRTDSGVHARDFGFTLEAGDDCGKIPVNAIPVAVSPFLPEDISVFGAELVSDDFHARYSVQYKEYEYLVLNSPIRDPFLKGRAYQYPIHADENRMNEAAGELVGKHDFRAFMSSGSDVSDTVRTVNYCKVVREGDLLRIRIAADGFLYNMVRIITGTLLEAGTGKRDSENIRKVLNELDRSKAGFTAPACGLYLNKVVY